MWYIFYFIGYILAYRLLKRLERNNRPPDTLMDVVPIAAVSLLSWGILFIWYSGAIGESLDNWWKRTLPKIKNYKPHKWL